MTRKYTKRNTKQYKLKNRANKKKKLHNTFKNYYTSPTIYNGGATTGCGSCGCPIAPLSWKDMNKFGGGGRAPFPLNNIKMEGTSNPLHNGSILGASGQIGGSCGLAGQCGQIPVNPSYQIRGGSNFYKPAPPLPGPFVGQPWGPNVTQWPGVDGIGGNRNYLLSYDTPKNNIVAMNPQYQMSMNDAGYKTLNSMVGGGSKKVIKSKVIKQKIMGGGILPQDLVNLGNDLDYNFKSAYNAINGYKAPVNPLPYRDQLTHSLNNNRMFL